MDKQGDLNIKTDSVPLLSVIVVVRELSENFLLLLEFLRAQTAAPFLELVLVFSTTDKMDLSSISGFGFCDRKNVLLKDISDLGKAKAAGVTAASASLIVFVEDHSYPAPDWAAVLIKAHQENEVAAVGPVVLNANPGSAVSWGCYLCFYSEWMAEENQENIQHLPGNQSSYRKDILLAYGDRLVDKLQAESLLHWELVSRGERLRLDSAARVYHLNFSRLTPILMEYFYASRVFAAGRSEQWSIIRRMIFFFGSFLLPWIRTFRVLNRFQSARLPNFVFFKALIPLFLSFMSGAKGEACGYAAGFGKAIDKLENIEKNRSLYFTAQDIEAVRKLYK